jgi:hypothetical protein
VTARFPRVGTALVRAARPITAARVEVRFTIVVVEGMDD